MKGDRSLNKLREALQVLRAALIMPGVLPIGDSYELRLSNEAGRKFEIFVKTQLEAYYLVPHFFDDAPREDHRCLDLDGVTVSWPVERMALPNRRSVLRPVPDVVYSVDDLPGGVKP